MNERRREPAGAYDDDHDPAEGLIRNAFESSNTGRFIVSSDGTLVQVNNALAAFAGYTSPDDMSAAVPSLTTLLADPLQAADILAAMDRPGASVFHRIRLCRQDGSFTEADMDILPFDKGGISAAEVLVRDCDCSPTTAANTVFPCCEYHALLHNINDMFYTLDANGIIRFISPAVEAILGYTPADVTGKSIFEFIALEDIDWVKENFQTVLEGTQMNVEIRLLARDGTWRWFDTSTFPFARRDADTQIMGLAHDITARRNAEAAQREQESMLAEAHRIARLGRWEYLFDQDACRLSPTANDIIGYTGNTAPIPAATAFSFIHPDDLRQTIAVYTDASATGSAADLIVRIVMPDGVLRHTHIRAETECGDDGRPRRLVGTIQDITAVKAIERDLLLFKSLVETSGQGFCVSTPNGSITYLNNTCCSMLDADRPEQYLEKKVRSLFPQQVRKKAHRDIVAAVRKGGSWSGELPILTATGRALPVYATVVPITGNSGRIEFIGWVFTDITELKESASELRTANEFLSNIMNAISDPVIIRDDNLRFVLMNDAASELLMRTKRELIGTTSLNFLPPGVGKRVDDSDRRVLETGDAEIVEIPVDYPENPRTLLEKKTRFIDPVCGQRFTITVIRDITELKRIEQELTRYRDQLEDLVDRRTTELVKVNRILKQEIKERQNMEERLRRSEDSLAEKALTLQDANTALKVLIEYQDAEKQRLSENIRHSLRSLITPYLEKLRAGITDEGQHMLLHIIETNLTEITRPFSKTLLSGTTHLSMTEVQVAKLTSDGRTAKEIAEIVAISENTVKVHKRNIRKKLGITGSQVNLRTHLQHLFDDDTLSMAIYGHHE